MIRCFPLFILLFCFLLLGIAGDREADDIRDSVENNGRSLAAIDEVIKVSFDAFERVARTSNAECRAKKKIVFTPR